MGHLASYFPSFGTWSRFPVCTTKRSAHTASWVGFVCSCKPYASDYESELNPTFVWVPVILGNVPGSKVLYMNWVPIALLRKCRPEWVSNLTKVIELLRSGEIEILTADWSLEFRVCRNVAAVFPPAVLWATHPPPGTRETWGSCKDA